MGYEAITGVHASAYKSVTVPFLESLSKLDFTDKKLEWAE